LVNVAWFKLAICLPPPDVPSGTPGRAAFGAKLIEANLTLEGTNAGTPGWHPWFMQATPYNPGVGTRNAAATVEVQSFDRAMPEVTLSAKRDKSGGTLVAGRLTAGGNGKALGGLTVTITDGKKPLGTAKTNG